MEITSKILQILEKQEIKSAKGSFTKQDIIVEISNQYSKKICISFWGDKIRMLDDLKPDDIVIVNFDVESTEYNGKWFTNCKASFLEKFQEAPKHIEPESNHLIFKTEEIEDNDLPF